MSAQRIISGIALVVAGGALAAYFTAAKSPFNAKVSLSDKLQPSTTPSAAPPFSDPYFVQMADRLRLEGESRDLFQRANPIFVDNLELGNALVGEVRRGQIRFTSRYRNRTDTQAVKYLAHEFLHVVWFQKTGTRGLAGDSEKRRELKAAIDEVYRRYPAYFDQQFKVYNTYFSDPSKTVQTGSEQWYREMHSMLGTEVFDGILPSSLIIWYSKWLPNRTILPAEFAG